MIGNRKYASSFINTIYRISIDTMTGLLTLTRSSLLRLATLRAFFRVLLMKAGELSPAIAFCSSRVFARISSGLRPLAASSLCMAARI